jgi:deazaflavin-dependent oxidoreductase (nitroreductase family)
MRTARTVPPPTPLAAVAAAQYAYLTTVGRVSGEPREIEIWFSTAGRSIYLISGGEDRSNWVRNLIANPAASVRIGPHGGRYQARFELTDAERQTAAHGLAAKYRPGAGDDWKAGYLIALDLVSGPTA